MSVCARQGYAAHFEEPLWKNQYSIPAHHHQFEAFPSSPTIQISQDFANISSGSSVLNMLFVLFSQHREPEEVPHIFKNSLIIDFFNMNHMSETYHVRQSLNTHLFVHKSNIHILCTQVNQRKLKFDSESRTSKTCCFLSSVNDSSFFTLLLLGRTQAHTLSSLKGGIWVRNQLSYRPGPTNFHLVCALSWYVSFL